METGSCSIHLDLFTPIAVIKGVVAKLDIQCLGLLRFARNDSQTSFLSLRGVPIHRDDAAILTLATSPKPKWYNYFVPSSSIWLAGAFNSELYCLGDRLRSTLLIVLRARGGLGGARKIDCVFAIASSSGNAWQVLTCSSRSRASIST